jgi:membrane-associated protease RseP (regulator of RpoE activity)
MKALCLAVLALGLAACGPAPIEKLRLVTLAGPDAPGLSLRELPSPTLESIGLSYGLAVVHAGAAAERAGLRVGDVVYGVDRQAVRNLEEFSRLVGERSGGTIGLLVRRGKNDFYVAMQLDAEPASPWPGRAPRDTLLRT